MRLRFASLEQAGGLVLSDQLEDDREGAVGRFPQ
jgi:hypothetical protein